MAFYITINKIAETADICTYEFLDHEAGRGVLQIGKDTGDITEIMAAPGDTAGRIFERAAVKVLRHWKIGEYPAETCWAS
ncbi:hypothetical protein [Duganella sp. Root198D2]|uniref:hypothetical protein n=1 Tax=Duganella sp. Root198D2 TaxID=1736489 RepID=UPI00070E4A47|nr:hypothetical protein [Duganella sp. Root198D2]KRB98278.1 hypothetical protein ASE26_25550 [Duganella sp. Root198D2]